MYFENCCSCNLIGFALFVAVSIWFYVKWKYSYWSRKNVPYVEPTFPFGNSGNPLKPKQPLFCDVSDVYNELKSQGHKHGGFYSLILPNSYVPIDPEYIKNIMAKDFNHFVNRGVYFNEKDDPLSAHLVFMEDKPWRDMRTKLTPTFTSGKMKMMFQTLKDCSVPLVEEIDKLSANNESLDIKELVARFTTDIIGSCAFGIECNSFKYPEAEFRKFGKKVFAANFSKIFRGLFTTIWPNLSKFLRIRRIDRSITSFFKGVVENTVTYREENNYSRPDFMQLLIKLKNCDNGLTINEIAAQAYIFFVAGFETSSTTMTYCLHELAINQNIQDKLREEIETVLSKHNDDISYDSIQDMKYLSQVIDETLRKYPPVPVLPRVCNKTYRVPGTDVVLEKGTTVFIAIYGVHHDPEYYPEPEIFDPERFSEENKKNALPFTYLPFGEGPRICIGLRFGLMQTKIGLVTILKNYKLTLNKNTPKTLTMNPNAILLSNAETILLDSKKISTTL